MKNSNGVEGYIDEKDVDLISGYKGCKVFEIAMKKIGCPYVYGASGPNTFDSMGIVYYAYKQIGMNIPRTIKGITSTYKNPSKPLKGHIVVYNQGKSIGLLQRIVPHHIDISKHHVTSYLISCIEVSIKQGVVYTTFTCDPNGYQVYQVF